MFFDIILFLVLIYFMWAPEEWGRKLAQARRAYDDELRKDTNK